ncbi:MAG: hypothetical protein HC840_01150 [Leptolyngbyaceae cyanobacterium RM2_2_4]|nr:hypothetical protein [Leptolyngbyaceae cyanobacterium RM2_2_4]
MKLIIAPTIAFLGAILMALGIDVTETAIEQITTAAITIAGIIATALQGSVVSKK